MKLKLNKPITLRAEPLSGILHLIAWVVTFYSIIELSVLATKQESLVKIISFAVFSVSANLLYLASTTYHLIPLREGVEKVIFQKIDHSMIFLLIAGTYTPICLITLHKSLGNYLIFIVWALAIIGIILKWTKLKIPDTISTLSYLAMACTGLIDSKYLFSVLPSEGDLYLLLGGASYVIGIIVFLSENKWDADGKYYLHEMWHILVVLGTLSHYILMRNFLMYM